MEELGETQAERFNAVFKGGLRVQTTFNPAAQYLALNAVDQQLPDTGGQFTAALASVDPETGAVRAMVGGPGFDEYKYNLVTQGERQPGSSFKIFVLVTALKNGFTPGDIVNGQGPCEFDNPGGAPDPYVAGNFGGSRGSKASITSLTTSSSNCGFLRLGQLVGLDNVVETARQMGVTAELDPRVLSLPLGAEEVSPLDMATAAATLANGGVRHRPFFIESVTDVEGNVIYERQSRGRRVMSEQVACLATQVLEANVTGGTGTAARLSGMPSAGKTGTAQNFEDAWFVGYTPHLATSVWMGNAARKIPMLGVGGRNVTGGSFPAAIWGAFNEPAHQVSPFEPFPTCQPTRPPNDLTRFFDPEPEVQIPDFSDLINSAPIPGPQAPAPTVVQISCPDGFTGQDTNGDGQIDSCIQNQPPPPPPTQPPPPTNTATIPP